jgi:hypothetical protein
MLTAEIRDEKEHPILDMNVAAWMIAGGPQIRNPSAEREREQLRAFRESQRVVHVGLIDRLRGFARPATTEDDLVTCAA